MPVVEKRKIFGDYQDNQDALCIGDEAARILTMRAATEQGVYRPYTSRSLTKAVQNTQILVPVRIGTKCFYDVEQVKNMPFKPTRGRKPLSVEKIRLKLQEVEASPVPTNSKAAKRLKESIIWWKQYLALAEDAQRACDLYRENEARLVAEHMKLEPPPKVANV
jgi:hypothetical protein